MAIATRPKAKAHHKKRQAGHHRHTKQYVKTYWPYIPLVALTASSLTLLRNGGNTKAGSVLADDPTTTVAVAGFHPSSSLMALVALIAAGAIAGYIVYAQIARES
jgi:hypothetical protein